MDVIRGYSSDQILEGVHEENACYDCDGTGVVFANGSRDTEVMCGRCDWTGIDPLTRPAPDDADNEDGCPYPAPEDEYSDDNDYRRVYWHNRPWAEVDYY